MASNGSLKNVSGPKKFGLMMPVKKPSSAPTSTPFGLKPSSSSSSSSSKPTIPKNPSAFHQDSDDELEKDSDDDEANTINEFTKSKKESAASIRAKVNQEVIKAQKATYSSTSAKAKVIQEKAMEEDPNIFDYDGVYDAMKEVEENKRRQRDLGEVDGSGKKKPRYMANLLAAAVNRKIDQARYEDLKSQRERQEEGDMYGDKDAFVTEAYKQKQEELKRLEEEEKKKNAMQKEGDMSIFYRQYLDSLETGAATTLTPEQIKLAAQERERREKEAEEERQERLQAAIKAGEAKINDSNELVDKRALLTRGLNISKSKIRSLQQEKEDEERERQETRERERRRREEEEAEREERRKEAEKRRVKEELARRLREDVERQKVLEEEKLRKAQEEEKLALAAKMAKKATEETVSDAKARYLARKAAMSKSTKLEESDSD
ncbi:hypothetical protein HDU76_003347 [Blyttiomyces sp. JEL0837]|nr:hypothetical protein HDU76_003347 [Blyttiomyces sp. JEL0837]